MTGTDVRVGSYRQLLNQQTLVKARFVELFGNPVYNTNDLPIRSLNELGNWASGGTPSRTVPEYFEGNIDWYSAGELNTLFLEGSVEKITEEAIEKSATKLFKAGSLLIGMYDTAAFKMGILKEDSASNQACACITPNDEVNIIWLYYELQMMKEYFLSQRRGVRQKNLNLGMIKAFKIPIAKRDQQDEFSDFVKQVDKSKVKVQKALDETQKLFDSLMQQYFGQKGEVVVIGEGRESKKDNDLFYTCSLIDYIARKTKNTRADVVNKLGKQRIDKIYDLADVYHCDNIDRVSDDFIEEAGIQEGNFDNVGECKYSIPSHWDIGKVYKRLIKMVAADENIGIVDALIKVYNSFISAKIDNYNSSVYYENPAYIFESYRENKML